MFTRKAMNLSISIIVVAACFAVSPALKAYTDLDAERVSLLLSEAKTEALQLKLDASEMESFTASKLSWESHAEKLREIKEHVNKVGEITSQLNAERAGAAPWQKVAINRVNPLMTELAMTVQATIGHLNMNRERLQASDYTDYLRITSELAAKMAALVADFVDYGETKAKFENLSRKLEVSER